MATTLADRATKIFIINRSDLEGRFDPKFIEPSRLKFYEKLKKNRNVIRFKEIIEEGSYGVLPPGDSYNKSNPIKFIRATELKEDLQIDFDDVYYVEEKYYTKRASIKKDDVLLAVKGATIAGNKCVSIVKENPGRCIINGSIFRIKVKANALPLYVAYILNSDLLKKQMKYNLVSNNAVDYLDKSLINNLLLPLPEITEQRKIVKIYQSAYDQKREKEQRAKELLVSIDAYILSELGIKVPETTVGIKNRIFTTDYSELAGVRFDPLYFKNKGTIESTKFKNSFLSKIASVNKGQSITREKISEGNYPVIAGGQSSPYSHSEYNFEGNVITISASGAYSGFVWYHDYKIFASDCIVLKSKDETDVSTQFIYFYLKAIQKEIYKMQQGAGQPHVYARDVEKILVPTPPLIKQKEILKHINGIRQKIDDLQNAAISILETSTREVEKMILGE